MKPIALLLLVGLITLDATAAKRPNVVILLAEIWDQRILAATAGQ